MPRHPRVHAEGLLYHVMARGNDGQKIFLRQGGRVLDEYLPRFLQLGQTSLRLIRVRRVGIIFYDLPIKFRSVRLVELLLFELRGIV